eukprot:875256-Prymnesium_polylepis.1
MGHDRTAVGGCSVSRDVLVLSGSDLGLHASPSGVPRHDARPRATTARQMFVAQHRPPREAGRHRPGPVSGVSLSGRTITQLSIHGNAITIHNELKLQLI